MSYIINSENTVWRYIDDEVIILNLEGGHYFILNNTGAMIWSLLENNKGLEEIIQTICEEYQKPQEMIRQDVSEIIDHLIKENLIQKSLLATEKKE